MRRGILHRKEDKPIAMKTSDLRVCPGRIRILELKKELAREKRIDEAKDRGIETTNLLGGTRDI